MILLFYKVAEASPQFYEGCKSPPKFVFSSENKRGVRGSLALVPAA